MLIERVSDILSHRREKEMYPSVCIAKMKKTELLNIKANSFGPALVEVNLIMKKMFMYGKLTFTVLFHVQRPICS